MSFLTFGKVNCRSSRGGDARLWPVRLGPIFGRPKNFERLRPISTQANSMLCVVCCGCCCGVSLMFCCVAWCVFKIFVQDLGAPPDPFRRTSSAGLPKMSLFFSVARHNFYSFFLSWGLFVECWWCFEDRALLCARLGSWAVHISGPRR